MASQVLSGATNASYTNNTGQNVRLIINYMSNVTSMTWANVNVTAESTTIGKDIQNITGEFRQAKTVPHPDAKLLGMSGLQMFVVGQLASGGRGPESPYPETYINVGGDVLIPNRKIAQGSALAESNIFYIPSTISRGGNFPVELMLANGQSFSSVCGAYNVIVIKEDGT